MELAGKPDTISISVKLSYRLGAGQGAFVTRRGSDSFSSNV